MPREFSRSQRMAEQIRRDLSEIVRVEIKDPRIGFLSFTAVKLSRDLATAVIYCSVLNDEQAQDTIQVLNNAAGFLRSKIAGRIKARSVPTFKFIYDDSVVRGATMDKLIQEAVSADKKNKNPEGDD